MNREEMEKRAKIDLKQSNLLLSTLHENFGDVIPVSENVSVSAANLAHMAKQLKNAPKLNC